MQSEEGEEEKINEKQPHNQMKESKEDDEKFHDKQLLISLDEEQDVASNQEEEVPHARSLKTIFKDNLHTDVQENCVVEENNAWLDNVRLKEPQTFRQMDIPEKPFIIDILKPLPFSLPTNLNHIFVVGNAESKGKWWKKSMTPRYYVKQWTKPQKRAMKKCLGRKRSAQPRVSFERGINKDAAGLNIKVHPP